MQGLPSAFYAILENMQLIQVIAKDRCEASLALLICLSAGLHTQYTQTQTQTQTQTIHPMYFVCTVNALYYFQTAEAVAERLLCCSGRHRLIAIMISIFAARS